MRGAVITLLSTVAIAAAVIGVSAWAPWDSDATEREATWVGAYVDWFDGVSDPEAMSTETCESRFDARVGNAPSGRFEPAATIARSSCRGLSSSRPDERWYSSFERVADSISSAHAQDARPTFERDLSEVATAIAGRRARVYCWDQSRWDSYSEQASLLWGIEFWPWGLATPPAGRIDLAQSGCDPLRKFFRSSYAPFLSTESWLLAEALVLLAHEAEHLRTPRASEAVVECHALQRVRALVRDRGRGLRYQAEMAGLAWDVGYPLQHDDYRTDACFSGGPLDLHPGSKNWP